MPGYTAQATPDLKACIDLIVRPGRHPLAPDITEARLERVAGASSGRIGKDTITSPDTLRRALRGAQQLLPYPLLVSVNQEGGRLNTLDWPQVAQLPANLALGAGRDPEAAELAGSVVAGQLRAAGLTWNLAPVCDLATWPSVPAVGTRSYGSDPEAVAAMAAAYVRGLQGGKVAATAKHFPGLGGITVDPHHHSPVTERLPHGALLPFRAAVEAGVACVMAGSHTVRALDDRPALASPRVLGLLRDDLGFTGVIVSENLSIPAVHQPFGGLSEAAVAAVAAGVDIVMLDSEISRGHQGFAQRAASVRRRALVARALWVAVRERRVSQGRIEEAAARVRALHHAYGLGADAVLPSWEEANAAAEHAARRIAGRSVAVVRGSRVLPFSSTEPVVAVRVPTTGERRADSARRAPDHLPDSLTRHRPVTSLGPGAAVPPGTGTVVVYGYDTGSAAATETARWVGAGRVVVQVALGDPDDLASSPADVLIAAFSPHRTSAESVADLLLGGRAPGPADVPVGGTTWQ
ncbi:glycoside hydrolase family 3 N-terminal domain-containing protein [Streptomyces sp. NPDC056844]|uniref:glycoside hydrolase family 3 N-terminal domain-containing protein n=1 Tax=unclassified Streptomyces TaxID=2593676 RepID=UPI00369590DB